MAIPPEMVRAAVVSPKGAPALSPADARRVLEIACLVVVSDRRIADEERAALRVLAGAFGGVAAAEIEQLIRAAGDLYTREERLARLEASSKGLSSEAARHVAYKASVVTAMADLATTDEEFELDLDLQTALDLTPEVADQLSGEVHEALTPRD